MDVYIPISNKRPSFMKKNTKHQFYKNVIINDVGTTKFIFKRDDNAL